MIFRSIIVINIFLVFSFNINAQNLDGEGFIRALAEEGDEIKKFINEDELLRSQILGITYYDQSNKFLIGYGLPQDIKEKIKQGSSNYELSYPMTGDGYGALTLSVPLENYKQIFYFKNDKHISPLTFHTRNYTKKESDYFKFFIDDTSYFNDYCMEKLDNFVDEMLAKMSFTAIERELLINEKFIYILCKDNEEIKRITGYDSRGMYAVAYDAVVSTFNNHYHEVSHGLMYYKLKNNIKPELMFFQEGFAVATGGRGGEGIYTNLNLGRFLIASNFVSWSDIFSNEGFNTNDASISYNAAAFCNVYMLSQFGFDKYLEHYKRFSGTYDEIGKFNSSEIGIFQSEDFNSYIENFPQMILLKYNGEEMKDIITGGDDVISGNEDYYRFKVKGGILLSEKEPPTGYKSKKFEEMLPGREYKGEKYYISVNNDGVSIYNLYTNELTALYSKGFSLTGEPVSYSNGFYEFYIMTGLFDEFLGDLTLSSVK